MLDILKPFRRNGAPRRAKPPPSDFWRIDLGPVAEPMANGHTEKMSLTTSERISLGKGKRVSAPPIGRGAERDFDWQSVPPPNLRRDPSGPHEEFNGKGFSPAALF